MQTKLYSVEGKETGTVELDDSVFCLPVNDDVIYYAVTNELANRRIGTACTKGRGEVHGSNAKPYKQKGTGRARRGDKKSPITVGGGTIFGPKPRDFSYAMPKKAKRLAMKSILSKKVVEDRLFVLSDFTSDGKTKNLVKILDNFAKNERAVLIIHNDDKMIKRAARNIPNLSLLNFDRLEAHTLFYGKKVLVLESATKKLSEFFGSAVDKGAN
ncbi:MAG: 50S ribosomal protein L4 [Spirochaetaceae bacterium]|nr:50S ribosomal protein L4 [Spirochaetaceae bacterium]